MAAAVILKEFGPPSVLAVETRDPTDRKPSEVSDQFALGVRAGAMPLTVGDADLRNIL